MPPPLPVAVLLLMVESVTSSATKPVLKMPPPSKGVELFLIWVCVQLTAPGVLDDVAVVYTPLQVKPVTTERDNEMRALEP